MMIFDIVLFLSLIALATAAILFFASEQTRSKHDR